MRAVAHEMDERLADRWVGGEIGMVRDALAQPVKDLDDTAAWWMLALAGFVERVTTHYELHLRGAISADEFAGFVGDEVGGLF